MFNIINSLTLEQWCTMVMVGFGLALICACIIDFPEATKDETTLDN